MDNEKKRKFIEVDLATHRMIEKMADKHKRKMKAEVRVMAELSHWTEINNQKILRETTR